jgi:hypothetical protein
MLGAPASPSDDVCAALQIESVREQIDRKNRCSGSTTPSCATGALKAFRLQRFKNLLSHHVLTFTAKWPSKEHLCKRTSFSWKKIENSDLISVFVFVLHFISDILFLISYRYNNELVKCLEDLREKREQVNKAILKEEKEKASIQKQV